MSAEKISVTDFLRRAQSAPVLDVRSPAEYLHAHVPGAVSMPLFSDEERKQVGTLYKQTSREDAIKAGLDFFGPKMRGIVEQVEMLLKKSRQKTLLVHCWRGGMRSGAVAWLLDLYGFEVFVLQGGYKAFRNWVLEQFRKDFPFQLIGGHTGSGKTEVLKYLSQSGQRVIDLEALACHKGSAFGGLDRLPQPSAEMFENLVAVQLAKYMWENPLKAIWIEDESQRIGDINMPSELWNRFRSKPLYFLEIPFEKRLEYVLQEYGSFSKEALINAIVRIQKRLGGLETKTAVNCLLEHDVKGCFAILLKYYDKHYLKALQNRPQLDEVLVRIPLTDVNPPSNAYVLINLFNERHGNE